MLEVVLTVRDEHGRSVDTTRVGVDELVAVIRTRPPHPGPGAVPGEQDLDLAVYGPAMLSLEAVEQLSRQVAALRAACVAAVADETPGGAGTDRVLDEVSCALVVSRRSATHTRNTAETLRHQPAVWAALARGELDLTRARILAHALHEIPGADPDGVPREGYEEDCAALLAEGLAYAQEHTARRLELYLHRRLRALGCPDHPRRRARGLAERGVWVGHHGDGTADLVARLASQDAERVYSVIRACALADRNGDPTHHDTNPREPLDLWLAAALVDLILDPNPEQCTPSAVDNSDRVLARRPRVDTIITVTIPVDSLAGLTDTPGVINGFGVIPAADARRLAAGDTRWRHVLTCRATGAVLDVGTLTYRPPAALARHVHLRDGTCRFPGCTVPATECDLDHLIPFPTGPTSAENLHSLCRRHHGLKHEGSWTVEPAPGSRLRWTSPQGATALSHPDDNHTHVA
ncbi:MAG TPA: DUF222 domain-containing protein [Motilibacterales bacterium]|nr:DUF222 domain-containing protein [Motilibacterales bacterium]